MQKWMKGKHNAVSNTVMTNATTSFMQTHSYSGKLCPRLACYAGTLKEDSWIIDTRVSDHIIFGSQVLQNITNTYTPITICLRNGDVLTINKKGNIKLHESFTLTKVLLIPSFKLNLLLVFKLLQNTKIHFFFLSVVFFRIRRLVQ